MEKDPRSYIQQNLDRSEAEGIEPSPEVLGEWFLKHERSARAEAIDLMNRDAATRKDDELSIEEAYRYLEGELPYEKMLRHVHKVASKVGR